MADSWYYAVGGQQYGPVSEESLRRSLASGQVGREALAWKEGMAQWSPVSLLPELVTDGSTPAGIDGGLFPGQPGGVPLSYGGYQPSPVMAASGEPRREYGGFWIRVAAYIIDSLVLIVPNMIVSAIAQTAIGRLRAQSAADPMAIVSITMLSSIPTMIVDWLYYALMESSSNQATLGKMACGLMVIDENGQRLSFGHASGRYFAKILSGLILGIGFLMVAFDQRKRGLHDQIARTFVVTKMSLKMWG